MKLQYKVASWREIDINDTISSEDIVKFIAEGNSIEDINKLYKENVWEDNQIDDSEYEMNTNENNGESTIKLLDNDFQILWENNQLDIEEEYDYYDIHVFYSRKDGFSVFLKCLSSFDDDDDIIEEAVRQGILDDEDVRYVDYVLSIDENDYNSWKN